MNKRDIVYVQCVWHGEYLLIHRTHIFQYHDCSRRRRRSQNLDYSANIPIVPDLKWFDIGMSYTHNWCLYYIQSSKINGCVELRVLIMMMNVCKMMDIPKGKKSNRNKKKILMNEWMEMKIMWNKIMLRC